MKKYFLSDCSNSFLGSFLFFFPFLFLFLTSFLGARETQSLDGVWNFSTDENQKGEILVPGIWNNQGFGAENDKIRWGYIGVGHYERSVEVPENWEGMSVFLVLEGISRYAKVFVDGNAAGDELLGLIGPHEIEITPWVKPGKTQKLQIDVDSRRRWEIDGMLGAAQLNDYMDVIWGGLWGHARLEARPKTYLKNIYIRSDIHKSTCTAEVEFEGKLLPENSLKLEIFDAQGKNLKASKTQDAENKISVQVPDVKLWSPETPNLYWARLTLLKDGTPCDSLETRFGMREIRVDGYKILLNGKRLMLCGYGDDHIYPHEFSMSSDKEMYLSRLRLIKSFGFNHVRHHSTIMPREYYDACDEVGILPMAEFVIGYPTEVPGIGARWKQNVPDGTDPAPAIDLYMNRFAAVIREHRNHPCIFAWVFGNELSMGDPTPEWTALFERSCKIARTLDPDRLFLDFDGDWVWKLAKDSRETTDLYSALFDEWTNPVTNAEKFQLEKPRKPVISHESGNFITFSRPDQIEMFDGLAYKPFWMVDGKKKLEELGLLDEAEKWAVASENLYFLLHKSNVETLRKNEYLSGFHWWLIQDYWTTSNGLVDYFFRPKSISPERVRSVNAPAVLLQEGLLRQYESGENLKIETILSNFTGENLSGKISVTYSILPNGVSYALSPAASGTPDGAAGRVSDGVSGGASGGVSGGVAVEEGTVGSGGTFEGVLPKVERPTQILVCMDFVQNSYSREKTIHNEWTTWIFPKQIQPNVERKIYVQEDLAPLFEGWNVSAIPTSGPLPENAIYVVSRLDLRTSNALIHGAKVVLLGSLPTLPSTKIRFQSSWWKGGDSEQENRCGTYVYDNSVTDASVCGHWCDGAWCELLDDAFKFQLDKISNPPEIFIRALPSIVRVQNSAVLFRVGVGTENGTLIVSGLNHGAAGSENRLNRWTLARMLEAAETVSPVTWDAEAVIPKISVPEGTVLGFQRIRNPGESSVWKSYREENAPMFVSRQTAVGNVVSWETDVPDCEKDASADSVTFVFAGGLGYSGQPKTDGFQLQFDGKDVLKFDLPNDDSDTLWKSGDGKFQLRFEILRSEPQDRFGRFYLTVSRTVFEGEAPRTHTLSVVSLGSGSARWFGLYPYFDLYEY